MMDYQRISKINFKYNPAGKRDPGISQNHLSGIFQCQNTLHLELEHAIKQRTPG